MEVRPGYRHTDVGVVPEDWRIHPVGDSMRLINGRAFKPGDWKTSGLPIIRIQNLNDSDSSYNHCSGAVEDRHRVEGGDLLFAWSGTTGTSFGARVWKGPVGVLNQHIFKVIPDSSKLTRRYALLAMQNVQAQIEKQAHGFKSSFVHVKKSDLVGVLLPLPPTIAEQDAISDALGDADALIESLEELLAKKRELKQGAMQELLTGKKRLPRFSGRWCMKPFGQIAQPRRERIDPRRGERQSFCIELEHIEQETGCLTGSTATSEASSLKAVFRKGDVLFGKLRAYLRKYWLASGDGVCSTEIWALAADRSLVVPQFLLQVVKTDGFIQAAGSAYGTHMPRSDWNVLRNYGVLLPSIPEQTEIAAALSDMDSEIAMLQTRLTKARQIKQGMMQELLTGKTRLV